MVQRCGRRVAVCSQDVEVGVGVGVVVALWSRGQEVVNAVSGGI